MKPVLRLALAFGWAFIFIALGAYVTLYLVEAVYETPLRLEGLHFERPWAVLLLPASLFVLLTRGWLQADAAPRLRFSRGRDIVQARRGMRVWMREALTGLRVATVTLLAVALTGPQSVHARDRSEVEGIDLILTLDLSLSMQATDIRPNRFEAMQVVVDEFIARRENDRIGAVVFGREAYTLLPLTTDKEALRNTIAEMQLGTIDGRGTAIGNGVGVSLNRLRSSRAKSKVIILLTDGDSNSGNVSPQQATEFAHTMGVKVFTVLMGESDESRVQRGFDVFGRPMWQQGNFPVNPELLRTMATRTGGEYFQAADREGLERSFHQILDRLERAAIEDAGTVYGELFPAVLWPAVVLLGLEVFLGALVFRRWP